MSWKVKNTKIRRDMVKKSPLEEFREALEDSSKAVLEPLDNLIKESARQLKEKQQQDRNASK